MKNNFNLQIRHVEFADKDFWFSLDKHMSAVEFSKKVRDKQGYVLSAGDKPIGILRYNLFWDNTPFCTLIFIDKTFRKQGCGKILMRFWENEMRLLRYNLVLVSTQANEEAQHFYRKIGYSDCGNLMIKNQPTELFLQKAL